MLLDHTLQQSGAAERKTQWQSYVGRKPGGDCRIGEGRTATDVRSVECSITKLRLERIGAVGEPPQKVIDDIRAARSPPTEIKSSQTVASHRPGLETCRLDRTTFISPVSLTHRVTVKAFHG